MDTSLYPAEDLRNVQTSDILPSVCPRVFTLLSIRAPAASPREDAAEQAVTYDGEMLCLYDYKTGCVMFSSHRRDLCGGAWKDLHPLFKKKR